MRLAKWLILPLVWAAVGLPVVSGGPACAHTGHCAQWLSQQLRTWHCHICTHALVISLAVCSMMGLQYTPALQHVCDYVEVVVSMVVSGGGVLSLAGWWWLLLTALHHYTVPVSPSSAASRGQLVGASTASAGLWPAALQAWPALALTPSPVQPATNDEHILKQNCFALYTKNLKSINHKIV